MEHGLTTRLVEYRLYIQGLGICKQINTVAFSLFAQTSVDPTTTKLVTLPPMSYEPIFVKTKMELLGFCPLQHVSPGAFVMQ